MKIKALALAAALGLIAALPQTAQAGSDIKIYPIASSHNYCPAGLRPVSIDGTVSCGTPNQHITYQQVMVHPVTTRRHYRATHQPRRSARAECAIGTKGCTYD
jgi:hypothetical protein